MIILIVFLLLLQAATAIAFYMVLERCARINSAYHTAYRRMREQYITLASKIGDKEYMEAIYRILNKDHALIVEAHLKRKTRKVNMSKETA